MAAPRTQLLRLRRLAFSPTTSPPTSAATAAAAPNRISSSLSLRLARNLSTATRSAPDPPAPFPPTFTASGTQKQQNPKTTERPVPARHSAANTVHRKNGTVVSAGRMNKTVRVQVKETEYDKHFRRSFAKKTNYMVHDPRNSLREGDVVEFVDGWRASRRVRHVVDRLIVPFGTGPEERPAILDRKGREAELEKAKKAGKVGTVRTGKIKRRVMGRLGREQKRFAAETARMRLEEKKTRRETEKAIRDAKLKEQETKKMMREEEARWLEEKEKRAADPKVQENEERIRLAKQKQEELKRQQEELHIMQKAMKHLKKRNPDGSGGSEST